MKFVGVDGGEVTLTLSVDEALVLFDRVARTNDARLAELRARSSAEVFGRGHPEAFDAEQIVMSNLEMVLQDGLVAVTLDPDYEGKVAMAKDRLLDERYGRE